MKTQKLEKFFLASVATMFFISCGNKSEKENQSTEDQGKVTEVEIPGKAEEEKGNFLYSAERLKKAQEDLKNLPQFKGKEFNVFQTVHFYDRGLIKLEIQDPEKPENIDHYKYEKGKWYDPQPVQISGGGNINDNVTPMKDIDFTIVAKYAEIWSEKAKDIEGAENSEVDHVYFSLWVPNQTRSWNGSNIKGARAGYTLKLKLDGSIESFKKN